MNIHDINISSCCRVIMTRFLIFSVYFCSFISLLSATKLYAKDDIYPKGINSKPDKLCYWVKQNNAEGAEKLLSEDHFLKISDIINCKNFEDNDYRFFFENDFDLSSKTRISHYSQYQEKSRTEPSYFTSDPRALEFLSKFSIAINSTDEIGQNALLYYYTRNYSIYSDNSIDSEFFKSMPKSTTMLINKGISIKRRSKFGRTSLMEAASAGNLETVKILLQNRVPMNTRAVNGATAISSSIFSYDVFDYLLRYKKDPANLKLTYSLNRGLLQKIVHKYGRIGGEYFNCDKAFKIINRLLLEKHRFNINNKDLNGETALDYANRSYADQSDNCRNIISLLKKHGSKSYRKANLMNEPSYSSWSIFNPYLTLNNDDSNQEFESISNSRISSKCFNCNYKYFNSEWRTLDLNLENTTWDNTILTYMNFIKINLKNNKFLNSSFYFFNVTESNLDNSLFRKNKWEFSNFRNNSMVNTVFTGSSMELADFSWSNLMNTDMSYCNLDSAMFFEANLTNAKLSQSNLSNIEFEGAILKNADLSGSKLHYTSLRKANLMGAKLTNVSLKNTDFSHAIWIDGRKCQEGSVNDCK